MIEELLLVFGYMFFISLTSFSSSANALFYEFGIERTNWITAQDYTAFLGFGFATPGPQLFSIATFIGYSAGGFPGALVGTIAIYAVPCILAVLVGRYLSRVIQHGRADYFLHAIGLAGAGLLAAIAITILRTNPLSIFYTLIAAGSFVAVVQWKFNPLLIIIVAGLLGAVFLR